MQRYMIEILDGGTLHIRYPVTAYDKGSALIGVVGKYGQLLNDLPDLEVRIIDN
jgi:hypothetical protein